jgi:NADH:ubiquinone oxidoreductase subunit E
MTPDQRRRLVHNAGRGAAFLMVASIAVLVADYVRARVLLPKDAATISALQEKAQSDRAFTPKLAAEQDRITRTRQGRKRRDDAVAIVLIGAAGIFIASAKWAAADRGRRPIALPIQAIRLELLTAGVSTRPSGLPAPAVAPSVDLSFVDALIEKEGRSAEAAIPILQAIQAHYRYLPDEALRRVCEQTHVTPAQIAGTSTFYSRFRRSPVGDHVVRVCHGTACHVSGARQITEELRRHLRIPDGSDTDGPRQFTIDEVACLGCCSLAPVLMVDEHTAGRLTPATAVAALDVVRQTEPA